MINNLIIGVTTIAFSKNQKLVGQLTKMGFKKVITNSKGIRLTQAELILFLSECDIAIVGLDKIDKYVLFITIFISKAVSRFIKPAFLDCLSVINARSSRLTLYGNSDFGK